MARRRTCRQGRFRFVREEEEEEEKGHHCLESLNARNRKFKRVERTNDGAKMQSRLLDRGLISYLNVATKLN